MRRVGGGDERWIFPPPEAVAAVRSQWLVACGYRYENWACLVRRLGGKGVQGACAPMAELALREQRGCFR